MAATTAKNNIVRSNNARSLIEAALPFLNSTVNFNQGDLIAVDTVNKVLKAIASDADTASFIGVATSTIVNGKPVTPYSTSVDGSAALTAIEGPQDTVTVKLSLNVGDSFNPGDKVYPIGSVDAQTVSSSKNVIAASKAIADITYTAVAGGSAGNAISVAYVGGATAGAESVTVIGNAISVKIAAGASTATQVLAAINASAPALSLVSAAITGTAANPQAVTAATFLVGGSQRAACGIFVGSAVAAVPAGSFGEVTLLAQYPMAY